MDQNPMKNQGDSEVLPPLLHRHPRVLTRADTDNGAPVAQRGSVIIWILVLVALFGALSFVVMQSSRTGTGTITDQQIKLLVSDIIQTSESIKIAIKQLKINGCSDTEISFESDATSTVYTNPSTPADNRCKVFHPNGGGLRHPPSFDKDISFMFAGYTDLDGIGNSNCGNTSCSDLYIGMNVTSTVLGKALCEQFNKAVGNNFSSTPVTTYMYITPAFTGTYGPTHYVSRPDFRGKYAGCFNYSPDPSRYLFYYTLLAR